MLSGLVQLIYITTVHCFQPFMLDQKMVLRLPSTQLLTTNKQNKARNKTKQQNQPNTQQNPHQQQIAKPKETKGNTNKTPQTLKA